ncbi:O-antigen ligase family protein [Paenibacillus mesophilus]|uniref:O-antigen ligase family protein n=1 Tax=Paenibacillus mesophilus TaxID=2582849 RepID=UPI00110E7160|nr:O-antigen ligase family protein [Paenibacillus mesophilus]TMV47314.1 O-antigen ligase family protein [Paenibacillus mesophilus]
MNQRLPFGVLTCFFGAGALLHGYFYEYEYMVMGSVLWTVLWIRMMLKDPFPPLSSFHLVLALLAAMYGASIFYAADREQAISEAIKISGLLPLAFIATTLSWKSFERLPQVWIWCGTIVTAIGVIWHMDRNGRLESTIEYANALAIFLLIALLAAVIRFVQSGKNPTLIASAILAAGLLLTMSRSVWVLWVGAMIACVFMFREVRKPVVWTRLLLGHAGGFLIAALVRRDPLFFWQRVKSIQPETSELQIRLVYWKDSLSLLSDHWLGGAGGGGWSMLQPLYRSKDYFVRYVHNHFLQISLDIGMIGLVLFLVLVIAFYAKCWELLSSWKMNADRVRIVKSAVLFVTVLLLHAGFDFDFSFPLLFGLLVCLMAVPFNQELEAKPPDSRSRTVFYRIAAAIIPAFLIWSGWVGTGYLYKRAAIAAVESGAPEESQQSFEKAAKMLPWSHTTRYESAKAYVLMGNAARNPAFYRLAEARLGEAIRLAPYEDLYRSFMDDVNKAVPNK